ncbi:MAG: cysteine dioxygenase [Burkholderiales bacterium]|nr:cysteine dioxygenase [Burkholderiales bacterium]
MSIARLRTFVQRMTRVVETHSAEQPLLDAARPLLADLITHDDWLPDAFAVPDPARYRQYLLYCDPFERFSLVSFVWGPGQKTPIHDHMVWGMVGVMRGAETCSEYDRRDGRLVQTGEHRVAPGGIDLVSPTLGDIHVVSNADPERPSVSIHCYGGNIGAVRRHVFAPDSGTPSEFISGYSSTVTPNLWDRSVETT